MNDYKLPQNGGQLSRLKAKQPIMVGLVTLFMKCVLNLLNGSGDKVCLIRSSDLIKLDWFCMFGLLKRLHCITDDCHYLTAIQYLVI